MQFGTRELMAFALLSSAFPMGAAGSGGGTTYPQRPITLVVGYPPGGATDALARLLSMYMSVDLGQKIIIDYRPGAGGSVGAEAVTRMEPDGYTLYLATRPNTIHRVLYRNIHYDFAKDLMPIGVVATLPYVIVTNKNSSINSVQDIIRLAQERPGGVSCASSGIATTSHLLCEMLQQDAGIEMLHVPYQGGGPALTDTIGGRVDIQIAAVAVALPQIKAGALRPIAVMSRFRVAAIQNVPTIEEAAGMPGLDLEAWFGLTAPAGTPAHVIARLNRSINTVLMSPDLQDGLVRLAYSAPLRPNTPEAFKELIAEEIERWTTIIRSRKIEQAP